MSETVTLQYPIKMADGRSVSALTLRRPKVRDLKNAQRNGGGNADQEIALLAAITMEHLTPEDMEELDMADYGNVQAVFQKMVGAVGGAAAG